jgi:hypothetical protein
VELPTHDRHAIVDILEDQIPDELKDEAAQAMSVLEEDAAEEDDQPAGQVSQRRTPDATTS